MAVHHWVYFRQQDCYKWDSQLRPWKWWWRYHHRRQVERSPGRGDCRRRW